MSQSNLIQTDRFVLSETERSSIEHEMHHYEDPRAASIEALKIVQKQLGIGLGQTTADGRFTLLPVCCLGNCDKAPALMIDDDTHGDVRPDGVAKLLEAYV